jgi:hypothetical protein
MNAPIEDQLCDYFTMVDRMQGHSDPTTQSQDAPALRLVAEPTRNTIEPTVEVTMLSPDQNQPPTTNDRWMMVAAAVAVLALAGGLLVVATRAADDPVPADQSGLPAPPGPIDQIDPDAVSVLVPGTEQWTGTPIVLSTGDAVLIKAEGAMTPEVRGVPLHGPDGVPDRPSAEFNVEGLEAENHNGLIGRIGEAGAPFHVGSRLQFVADTEGPLFLGLNDVDVANNAGVFTVTITVNPP